MFVNFPPWNISKDFSVEVAMDLDAMGYRFETDFLLEDA